MIETIYKQYMLQYEKDGRPPTRIILGAEVAREIYKGNFPCIDTFAGEIRCFGKPVTVDGDNPRLIHISKGEDYTAELEGAKE